MMGGGGILKGSEERPEVEAYLKLSLSSEVWGTAREWAPSGNSWHVTLIKPKKTALQHPQYRAPAGQLVSVTRTLRAWGGHCTALEH